MQGRGLVHFILRRLAVALPLLLIISFGVFALIHVAPGDPARALLGSRPSDPATLAAIREQYHLNDPFLVQYGIWLWHAVQGDFGRSIQGGQLVMSAIRQRLGVTIYLGIVSAIVVLGWFPTFGAGRGFLDRFWHLTLPSFALALSVMAITVKITRASMIEELDKDYVTFARARGLSVARITIAYVLRNALIPVVTAAGLIVVGLVANAIYVEVTFALPGLGSLTVDAVQKRDIPMIQGTTVLLSAFIILLNLLIDVIYTLIDPRIRFGRVDS